MSQSVDMHVLANRIASVVNERLQRFDQELNRLNERINRLEIELSTIRASTLETIIRSVLGVKMDEVVAAVGSKVVSELDKRFKTMQVILGEVEAVQQGLAGARDELARVVDMVREEVRQSVKRSVEEAVREALTDLVEKVSEVIPATPSASIDVSGVVSKLKSLEDGLLEVKRSQATLATAVEELRKSLSEINHTLRSMNEMMQFVYNVNRRIDERMQEVESGR